MREIRGLLIIFLLLNVIACKEDTLPKPQAVLRLEYPQPHYVDFHSDDCPFSMQLNGIASLVPKGQCVYDVNYDSMKATVFLTYKSVNNDIEKLLKDAEKLTYEHVVKADAIAPKTFVNEEDGVYGMFFKISGNAASQSQFYVTDSVNHFITGSLYFHAKPNYDSVLPAADYLENDIRKMMESIKWKK
ncbi:gliding motility-associated lipoprotein GldD [Zhouia amylolytica]|uniref:Gliding motility-associated lipoprotein GldD n=1 Tax=Zhouia amylolytica TaxID=376730 RepID=A0A1I6SIK0_9FLAO|nr:gliding motility lipoprotein GldD [Zhouia amylolytica]SFS76734.1 gliding motility-associated lipoprotein GldD [Zhouia amylolytica]